MICRMADSKSTAMQYLQFHKYVLLSMLALMNNMNYLLICKKFKTNKLSMATEFGYPIVLMIRGLLSFKLMH